VEAQHRLPAEPQGRTELQGTGIAPQGKVHQLADRCGTQGRGGKDKA
jgi:hypothetical protein